MSDSRVGKATVLVVDDEVNIVMSLSFLLRQEGYQVVTAYDGAAGLAQYAAHRPDIVLMDVMMPKMDGFAAATAIRSLDTSSTTSIIFLTAKGTSMDKQIGYMSGADDYVVKPFDNEMILEKVKEKAW